jgi:DNA-binding response OmpR family regulator
MTTLLLIDDEEAICSQFKRTLECFGFRVEVAHTWESALDCARKTQFDAILIEFNLKSRQGAHPRSGNGLTVIRRLRALEVAAPVLMFTAMEGDPYETASLDAGADDFILKTTSILTLVSRIRAHLRRGELASSNTTDSEKSAI